MNALAKNEIEYAKTFDELVAMVDHLKGYIPAMYVDGGHPERREAEALLARARQLT